jgi:hypothetical protein
MLTPRLLRIIILSPLLVAPAFAENFTLTGAQADATFVMSKGNTYTVKGDYVVPVGKKLEIGPGALINGEKGSKILIKGQLLVNAEEKVPALARGKSWNGIHAIEESKVSVTGLQVSGADVGLYIEGAVDTVKDCVFAKNTKGLKIVTTGKIAVTNCLFAENTVEGFRITGGIGGTITGCSFLKNKELGLTVGWSPLAIEKCLFMDNGASLEQSNPSGVGSIGGAECSFEGKGLIFASGLAHGKVEFPKCYWGEKNTKILTAKGEKAILPNVNDARNGRGSIKIFWAGFLTAAPKPCGATVVSKL